jgi:hypothetical protein
MTSDPTLPPPVTPHLLHEQHSLANSAERPSWHVPTRILCGRCGDVMVEREEAGILWVASGCGRRIEAHTLGLHLVFYTYQHLRRSGRVPALNLGGLAAILGIGLDHFRDHVNKMLINSYELHLLTTTDGPYLRSERIRVDDVESYPLVP